MKHIQLPSGFTYDYTHMVGDKAIRESEVEALADQIKAALEASEETRKTGVVRGHLSKDGDPELVLFPQLPYVVEGHLNSPNVIERLHDLGDYAQRGIDAVVSFGIGGSFLGGKVLFDVHGGEFWNSMSDDERNNYPRMYFSGNNVDPFRTAKLIDELKRHAEEYEEGDYKVMLVLISKSGSTIEPMSNFMIVEEALKAAHIDYEVIAVTDPRDDEKETLLHKLANEKGWPMFSVPDGVGGRFSVFTEVGLIVGSLIGFDIDGFLEGAKAMDKACESHDVWQNPALLSAVLKYIDYDINRFPLDVDEVCQKIGVQLISYSEFSEEEQELLLKRSQFGFFVPREIKQVPTIFYNDMICSQGCIRQTIFHEIKHYVNEDSIEDPSDDDLADYFGKYFACPIPYLVKLNITDVTKIVDKFGVSYQMGKYISENVKRRINKYGDKIFDYEKPLIQHLCGSEIIS